MLRKKFYAYSADVQVPSHINFGKCMLERMIEYGDQAALINTDNNDTMTFTELAQKTVDISLSLARIGVRKGDVVSICSNKRMEIIPTILGVICAGAVYSPTDNPPLIHRLKLSRPKVMFMSSNTFEHKPLLDTVGCIQTYIIYDEKNQDGFQNGCINPNGHDNPDGRGFKDGGSNKDGAVYFKNFLTETAEVSDFEPTPVEGWKDFVLIMFSSGTTGLPKGVPWTHMALLINSHSNMHDKYRKATMLITREWFLSYGLFITLACLRKGLTCVFSVRNQEEDYMRAIEKYKVKIIQSTPTAINQIIKSAILDRYDVTSVEALLSSSMPVFKEQVQAVKKIFPNLVGVYQIYGTSEAGGVCNEMYAPLGPRDGSCGTPSHGFMLKVVDFDTREPLGPYQRGEICFKSPTLTPGYIGKTSPDYLDSEGYYKSGDVGYYDEDGYFFVVNRIKDLIKCNDYSIVPAEIEALLCRHDQVREAGVASAHGMVGAVIVPKANTVVSRRELEEYFRTVVPSRMKLEGGVHFAPALPRGAGDKLDRRALQHMLENILKNEPIAPIYERAVLDNAGKER